MEKDLNTLNCLREDFIKWADNNEPSVYELELNRIGGKLTGFDSVTEPTVLLDCNKSKGDWYLCVNCSSENEIGCYPIESLSDKQISEIRIIVESWLARKDLDNFFI